MYPESRSLPQLHMLESHSGRLERSCKPPRKPREFESHLQLQKVGSIPARSSRSGEKRDRFDSYFSTGEQNDGIKLLNISFKQLAPALLVF